MTRKHPKKKGIGFVIFVIFFTVVIAASAGFRFYSAYQTRDWRGDSVFVVFNSRELTIEVYEPTSEKIVTYTLPKASYVEVPAGYGFYKIEDALELSVVEGKGETLLTQAVSNSFGIPFDATTTTLNDWDRMMVWYARVMYEDRDDTVNLAETPIFTKEERIDGEVLEKVDPRLVDSFFKHNLWERAITDENLAVGIFNASKEPNVALTLSRKLEKIGVHVTEIDNLIEELSGTCEMRVKEEKLEFYTTQRLARLFNCRISDTLPNPRFDIMMVTSGSI